MTERRLVAHVVTHRGWRAQSSTGCWQSSSPSFRKRLPRYSWVLWGIQRESLCSASDSLHHQRVPERFKCGSSRPDVTLRLPCRRHAHHQNNRTWASQHVIVITCLVFQ